MLKKVWIAQCDVCGRIEKATVKSGHYNEEAAQEILAIIDWKGANHD